MKSFKFPFIVTFFLVFLFLSQASTATLADNDKEKKGKSEIKIEIEKIIDNFKLKTNINRKEFEMSGIASNVSASSFTLNGENILIDISATGKLMQKGVLKNGSYVKVEGKVIDEKLYALHIKVRSKEADLTPTISVSPITTLSPIPSESVTPTPIISGTPTPTETQSLINLEDNENEENIFFMEDLIGLFKKFLKELEKELTIRG